MNEAPHGIDEGYVKYNVDWTPGAAPDSRLVAELNRCRAPLFRAGLIGHDERFDVGFGNLSIRTPAVGRFVITGTQTGHVEATTGDHYSLVTSVDIGANRVCCEGPVAASSETMTHAAIYALDEAIRAVVHVHSAALWQSLKHTLPTTRAEIAYGTPEMAAEFGRLWRETTFPAEGVAIMAGHEDGLLGFGATLEQASARILALKATR